MTTINDVEINLDNVPEWATHIAEMVDGDIIYHDFEKYFYQYSTGSTGIYFDEPTAYYFGGVHKHAVWNEPLPNNKENMMPELQAGKHMIITESGKKGLVLADGIVMFFEGDSAADFKGLGCDYIENVNGIKEVYELHIEQNYLSFDPKDAKWIKLIWSRNDGVVELTLAEIAAKIGVDVDKIWIKD